MVAQLCRKTSSRAGLRAQLEATTDRRAAITRRDYVICMIRQGGLEAFQLDIDIPLKYGVDQCVGDTLCAGGIMYGQRTIPVLLDFCKDIREVAKPGALFLNYSNPMAMNTWACNQYGGVKTIGLCHGVQGAHWQIAECVERGQTRRACCPTTKLHRDDVDVIAAGLNHQTWFIQVRVARHGHAPAAARSGSRRHPEYSPDRKGAHRRAAPLRLLLHRIQRPLSANTCPGTANARTKSCSGSTSRRWINGETGGYLRVCTEGRNWFETDFPNWLEEARPRSATDQRSEEHGSYIIEALETGRIYRGHFNVVNQGHITNLPDGCVIEIPGYVDRNGINMPVVGDLPLACAATCSASVRVQQMGVEAAVHGDVTLLKQAMLHDPLVGAVCNPEEVWQMTDEMLVAQAQWLPQYAAEIPAAKARLEEAERSGKRVKLVETQGAARLHTKTVDEMAADAPQRPPTPAADKGKMTKEGAH